MNTKLILREELTGFEKSPITKLIQKILIAQQIESELYTRKETWTNQQTMMELLHKQGI